jgi:3',5'-cyclic AMP phosphodiesterase CpdA
MRRRGLRTSCAAVAAAATAAHTCAAAALAVLALVALAGCGDGGASERAAAPGAGGSTVRTTWRDDGAGEPIRRPGERLRLRRALAASGQRASGAGRELARFGLVTDVHVRDEESPARVPFLDRLGPPFNSTFRPQEALTTQVLAGALRALRAERPRQILEAGDLIDNDQTNELDQALAVLHGGRVDPDSGARGYDGIQDASNPDPFYYRPDVDPPVHPGLLDEAQRAFVSPGAGVPWLPALGNHDWLVAGEVPVTPRIERAAVGDRTVIDVDAERALQELGTTRPDTAAIDRLLARGLPGREVHVPADPRRRMLSRAQVVRRLRAAAGVPGTGPDLDYVRDLGPKVRLVVLDTEATEAQRLAEPGGTNAQPDDGESAGRGTGSLTPAQTAWLQTQLARAGDRWVVVLAHRRLDAAALAVIGSHPRVVAVLNGDTHHNSIEPYRVAGEPGFWRVGTASLADWPEQARMFSLRETAGGGVVLETWTVDPEGGALVGISRELALLDAQGGRPLHEAGRRSDRNARLLRAPA